MTYCLGIKLEDGLVGLSDTRITAGNSATTKKKVFIRNSENSSLFIMTSGLRSVRDKAFYYFQEVIDNNATKIDKLYKIVNLFGEQIKRVAMEDEKSLRESGYRFDLNAIVGGQMPNDEEHKMFLLYSEGNWIELDSESPYVIIGNSGQGKAILNRVVNSQTSMKQAMKAAYLSFDSTRVSSNDVEFPIDFVLYPKDSYNVVEQHFELEDLAHISQIWAEKLKEDLEEIPEDWMDVVFAKVAKE